MKGGQWRLIKLVCNVVNTVRVLLWDTVTLVWMIFFSIFTFSFVFASFCCPVYRESWISYSDAVSMCNQVSRGIPPPPPRYTGQVVQSVFDPELPGQTIPRSEGPLGTFHSFNSNGSLLHSTSPLEWKKKKIKGKIKKRRAMFFPFSTFFSPNLDWFLPMISGTF